MDLKLTDQQFIVCGASSGFGEAIARLLLLEGARVILVARRGNVLKEKFRNFEEHTKIIEGSILYKETIDKIEQTAKTQPLNGIVFNAGGPPTGAPLSTNMDDWDAAWQLVMRWKIELALRLTPLFVENNYGRMLFIESKSVKQPMPQLVLSNAFRAGVVGFAKTLSTEVAPHGVTVNVLAPGSHETPAIERIIKNSSDWKNTTYDKEKQNMEANIPVGRMGTAEEFASLAAWLLSEHSGYVTGQTISHAGGSINGIFG